MLETEPKLERAPSIGEYQVELAADGTLELTLEQEDDLSAFFKAASDSSWKVVSVRNKSNRLEELFLSLVSSGQSLNAEEKV
ncbi:hypothetical protein A3765_24975 [Oleiphilus sp. HI0130]|nr:hypothetical protein A3765_24975 [Oleiphilus sp. HI0130]